MYIIWFEKRALTALKIQEMFTLKKYSVGVRRDFKQGNKHGRRNFKDTNPLMSSLLVIFVWGGETIRGPARPRIEPRTRATGRRPNHLAILSTPHPSTLILHNPLAAEQNSFATTWKNCLGCTVYKVKDSSSLEPVLSRIRPVYCRMINLEYVLHRTWLTYSGCYSSPSGLVIFIFYNDRTILKSQISMPKLKKLYRPCMKMGHICVTEDRV